MKEKIDTLYSFNAIEEKTSEIAKQIDEEFKDEPITIVCVLEGAKAFTETLLKFIKTDVELDYIKVSSYGDGTVSQGYIKIKKELENSITGKNVIIVEDIVDTGTTISSLIKHLEVQKPKTIKVCTLLEKPDRRLVNDFSIDYKGFIIPDKFVVGFGLDFNEKYRELDYIGILKFEV